MKRRTTYGLLFLAFSGWLLLAAGCEDTDPAAQSTWVLELTANPASHDLGPGQSGVSDLTAVLFNENGNPQAGIGVRFSSTGGVLDSNGALITTDSRGEARDTLRGITAETTVTVKSGAVEDEAVIRIGDLLGPEAGLNITPSVLARIGQAVTFSGSSSTPGTGDITTYTFTIISDNPDPSKSNPDVEETTAGTIVRTYQNPQHLEITMKVSDTNDLTDTAAEMYDIVDNLPPTAKAEPPSQTGNAFVNDRTGQYFCQATVSACTSTDPDGRFAAFEFLWGDGTSSFVFSEGNCRLEHSYGNPNTDGFTVTVTVFDDGDASTTECTNPTTPEEVIDGCPSRKNDTDQAIVICNPVT